MAFVAKSETDVQFAFASGQYDISQYTNVTVSLQMEKQNASGTITLLPGIKYLTTDTNASVTFSNLATSTTPIYYHWAILPFSNPSGTYPIPSIYNSGDIVITSTNAGLISATSVAAAWAPVYSGSGAAYTAQASDLRYATNGSTGGGGTTYTNTTDPAGVINGSGLGTNTSGIVTASAISSANSNAVNLTNAANQFTGNFSGDGSALNGLNASQITSGTVPLARLDPLVITNRESGVSLDGLTASNSTYGDLSFNKNTTSGGAQVDSFNALRLMTPHNKSLLFYDTQGSGAVTSYMLANGTTGPNLFGFRTLGGYAGNFFQFNMWDNAGVNGDAKWFQTPVTTYSYLNGGSASTLEDLPIEAKEIENAMPVPPIVFSTWFGNSTYNTNEVAVTNICAQLESMGFVSAITNAGGEAWLHMDSNTELFNTTRTMGYLTVNSNNFPDGENIGSVINGYGLKMMPTLYFYKYPTNNIVLTDLGLNTPATPPNYVGNDISELYAVGASGIRWADSGSNPGNYNMFCRKIAENILLPRKKGGLNYPFSEATTAGGLGLSRPMANEFLFQTLGMVPSGCYRQVNIVSWDADLNFPGSLYGSGQLCMDWMSEFRAQYLYEAQFRGKGHYGHPPAYLIPDAPSLNIAQWFLTISAIGLSEIQIAMNGDTSTNIFSSQTNLLTQVTNSTLLQVQFDQNCGRPYKIFDNGPTNTSGWYREMVNGQRAVALFNESASTTNIMVDFSAINSPFGKFNVVSAWDTNKEIGTFSGSFTYTNVPARTCELLLFKPVMELQNELVLMRTNLVSTNLSITPFSVTLTNNSLYKIETSAVISGLATTDHPNFWGWCTNATSAGNVWYVTATGGSVNQSTIFGYSESSAVSYPFPLSSTGSGFAVGNGCNRLFEFYNGGTPNVQKIHVSVNQLVEVTNAPCTIFYSAINQGAPTTTNTIVAGSFIKLTQTAERQ
ncbi:MAG: hypothetical protein KGL39_26405 [Patescibacteria group bacterium]|nr:hypothetical protein [Patescibacteria group bacterium]